MSKYTTELRFICETLAGETESQGFNDVDEIISEAAPLIFSFDFPLFDEEYRTELTEKIIRHYYTREIGFETYGLFKLKLQTKLNEIMPYYNQLYDSALLTIDPLNNFKMHKTSAGQDSDTTSGSSNTTTSDSSSTTTSNTGTNSSTTVNNTTTSNQTVADGEAWNKFSDTPQGAVTGLDNDSYLTNATKNTDHRIGVGSGTSEGSTNVMGNTSDSGTVAVMNSGTVAVMTSGSKTGTNSYVEDAIGFSGVNQSELLLKFRETFLNIDMMIIEDLEELFFQLW